MTNYVIDNVFEFMLPSACKEDQHWAISPWQLAERGQKARLVTQKIR
jgi:hypothetical protein